MIITKLRRIFSRFLLLIFYTQKSNLGKTYKIHMKDLGI